MGSISDSGRPGSSVGKSSEGDGPKSAGIGLGVSPGTGASSAGCFGTLQTGSWMGESPSVIYPGKSGWLGTLHCNGPLSSI